jgi:hypothetical protein
MNLGAVVVVSLCAAACYAGATNLKHLSAGNAPDASDLGVRQLARFIRASVTHRLWLLGIVADTAGLALHVYALHIGSLTIVQPLLVSGLIFALILNHRTTKDRLSRYELVLAVALTAGLVGFLLASGATSGANHHTVIQDADRGPAITIAVLGVLSTATLILLTRWGRRGNAAALLGIAVGIVYAASASLIKTCSDVAGGGVIALLTSWQLYTLIAVGTCGLVLNQLAFQAGPLTASLPAITVIDPLLSIAIGVWIFDERIRQTLAAVPVEVLCLVTFGAAAMALSKAAARQAASPVSA